MPLNIDLNTPIDPEMIEFNLSSYIDLNYPSSSTFNVSSIDLNVCPSNEEEEKEHEEICQDEFQDSFPSNDESNNDLILDEILAAMEEGI
jgi:anti-sigma factor ChrR (cupin superfamily)